MGDEMLVIAPKYGEGPGSYEGVPIHRVSSVPFPPYPQIKLAPVNPGVGRALRRFGPDLIHAVNPFVLGMGRASTTPGSLGVPLVASYHTNVAAYARFYKLDALRPGRALAHQAAAQPRRRQPLHLGGARSVICDRRASSGYTCGPRVSTPRTFTPSRFSKDWRVRLTSGHPAEQAAALRRPPQPREGHRQAESRFSTRCPGYAWPWSETDPRDGISKRSSPVRRPFLRACCRATSSRRRSPPPTLSCSPPPPRRWG